MRTYDKLIAVIWSSQGSRGLRSPFGTNLVTTVRPAHCVAAPQDTA